MPKTNTPGTPLPTRGGSLNLDHFSYSLNGLLGESMVALLDLKQGSNYDFSEALFLEAVIQTLKISPST